MKGLNYNATVQLNKIRLEACLSFLQWIEEVWTKKQGRQKLKFSHVQYIMIFVMQLEINKIIHAYLFQIALEIMWFNLYL